MSSAPTVLITRPAAQAHGLCEALRIHGLSALVLPLIGIQALSNTQALELSWHRLGLCDWVFFVSPNAVVQFFRARPRPGPSEWPQRTRVGALGPGTHQALLDAGVQATQITSAPAHSQQFDSEALWAQLAHYPWVGTKTLIVRGDGGRTWLSEQLRAHGAHVDFIQAYKRTLPAWGPYEKALLSQALRWPGQHVWLFSSSHAIDNLMILERTYAGHGWPRASQWHVCSALTTHERIAHRAAQVGLGRVLLTSPQPEGLQACIQSATW